MTLLAAERVYAIKGKGLVQQYQHLTSPVWFRSWKQNHPGSCSDDVLPPSSPQFLPRIFPHPLHNPSYISESRLRINAASSNVTHALEKRHRNSAFTKPLIRTALPAIRKFQIRRIWVLRFRIMNLSN